MKRFALTICVIALIVLTSWWAGERFDASPTVHPPTTTSVASEVTS